MQNADSWYDHSKPWDSLAERIVTDALGVADVPGDVLALLSPPPVVTRPLFPPRFGYRTAAIGIDDVFQVDRLFSPLVEGAGSIGGIQASSRNNLGDF